MSPLTQKSFQTYFPSAASCWIIGQKIHAALGKELSLTPKKLVAHHPAPASGNKIGNKILSKNTFAPASGNQRQQNRQQNPLKKYLR